MDQPSMQPHEVKCPSCPDQLLANVEMPLGRAALFFVQCPSCKVAWQATFCDCCSEVTLEPSRLVTFVEHGEGGQDEHPAH